MTSANNHYTTIDAESQGSVKKKLRVTIEFQASILEEVKDESKNSKKINDLLKVFLQDNKAISRLYRRWFIDELQISAGDNFKTSLLTDVINCFILESDSEILHPVLEKCPPSLKNHFLAVLDEDMKKTKGEGYSDLETFFYNFSLLKVLNASFDMVDDGK